MSFVKICEAESRCDACPLQKMYSHVETRTGGARKLQSGGYAELRDDLSERTLTENNRTLASIAGATAVNTVVSGLYVQNIVLNMP